MLLKYMQIFLAIKKKKKSRAYASIYSFANKGQEKRIRKTD